MTKIVYEVIKKSYIYDKSKIIKRIATERHNSSSQFPIKRIANVTYVPGTLLASNYALRYSKLNYNCTTNIKFVYNKELMPIRITSSCDKPIDVRYEYSKRDAKSKFVTRVYNNNILQLTTIPSNHSPYCKSIDEFAHSTNEPHPHIINIKSDDDKFVLFKDLLNNDIYIFDKSTRYLKYHIRQLEEEYGFYAITEIVKRDEMNRATKSIMYTTSFIANNITYNDNSVNYNFTLHINDELDYLLKDNRIFDLSKIVKPKNVNSVLSLILPYNPVYYGLSTIEKDNTSVSNIHYYENDIYTLSSREKIKDSLTCITDYLYSLNKDEKVNTIIIKKSIEY